METRHLKKGAPEHKGWKEEVPGTSNPTSRRDMTQSAANDSCSMPSSGVGPVQKSKQKPANDQATPKKTSSTRITATYYFVASEMERSYLLRY